MQSNIEISEEIMESSHSEFDPTAQPQQRVALPEAGRYVVRATSGPPKAWEDVCNFTANDRADLESGLKLIREAELRAMETGSQKIIGLRP